MDHPVCYVDLCAATSECGGVAYLVIVYFSVTLARTCALLAVWQDLSTCAPRANAEPCLQVYSRGAGADRCADHRGARFTGRFAIYPGPGIDWVTSRRWP